MTQLSNHFEKITSLILIDVTTSIKQERYSNGQLKEEIHYNGTQLANGWSYHTYFPNGQLQLQQCYSHGQLIEQKTFDENGSLTTHTIWNHRLQQMVDRPVVTPASQTQRPNIAQGCMTIYGIEEILPYIAELIEAPNRSEELLAAHDLFYGYSDNEEEKDIEEEEKSDEESWRLEGNKGSLSVLFERSEGYLFYFIHTPDINDYEKARQLVERAQNRNRFRTFYTKEDLLKNAAKTETPILYYFAPYRNRQWLEFEINVWGTEPVYSILNNLFTLSCHWIEANEDSINYAMSFLEPLPEWDNIIKEAIHGESSYYIIQQRNTSSVPILKNPSPIELEEFLKRYSTIQ